MKPIGFAILMVLLFIASLVGNRAWGQVTYYSDANGTPTGTSVSNQKSNSGSGLMGIGSFFG